jgi:hypothetical protein
MKQDLEIKNQVKHILTVVKKFAPGKSVELRIPPYAAIQCISGVTHRRGIPPNVVEMSAETLIKLLENPSQWHEFCDLGLISASGTNSNLTDLFFEVSRLMNSEVGRWYGKQI